jgi:predicted transcriptional regulator
MWRAPTMKGELMNAVLIGVRPQWCEKIASRQKTLEIRKNKPKIPTPFTCYIYCTKGSKHLCLMQNEGGVNLIACCDWTTALPVGGYISNGKVIGEFVCDKMYGIYYSTYPHDPLVFEEIGTLNRPNIREESCLTENEIDDYLNGETGYGWHISALQIYDKPRELSEFKQCHKCPYGDIDRCNEHEFSCDGTYALSRPPQSWCYVANISKDEALGGAK